VIFDHIPISYFLPSVFETSLIYSKITKKTLGSIDKDSINIIIGRMVIALGF